MSPDKIPNGTGLLKVRDVAAMLQMSRSWVYGRARSGDLPCIRLGGALRFDKAALLAYLADQERAR